MAANDRMTPSPMPAAACASPRRATRDAARVQSEALLGSRGELIIEHAGREYRLRQTSKGKLILTA